jgi:hypothetical protein
MPDHRSNERDRRLRRINQITGATLAGGIALTAGWSVAAAHSSAGTPSVPASPATADDGAQTPTTGAAQVPAATQQQTTTVPDDETPAVAPDQQQTQQTVAPATQQTAPPITSARHRSHKSAPVSGGS